MDWLTGRILAFVLVLSRVGAFFIVAPLFSWEAIPRRLKVAVAVLLSVFFAGILRIEVPDESLTVIRAVLLIANETIYGVALGTVCVILFSAIRVSARIAEQQMGFNMANIIDPLTGESAQPLSLLIEIIFIMLFFSANGHHLLLYTLSQSYQSFPVGTIPDLDILLKGVVSAGTTMLLASLKIAAPILAAFLLMMIVLAVMARIAPETNILFLSLPLRVGLGLIMIGIFFPFINAFVKELAQYMDKLLPI
ncbi:MAG: flagellar biosynthetic protein FliR [Sedimentisphaerales bacterium]|nr:flagellar biosynthetic protein FliR [Sedimentisphaerales bacterium]